MIAEQKSSIEIVRDHLDQPELLVQLAEEATELAQAALKLRRAYTGVNPTPITAKDAYQGLLEEIADVSNCITALGFDSGIYRMEVSRIASEKMKRWAERLEMEDDHGT